MEDEWNLLTKPAEPAAPPSEPPASTAAPPANGEAEAEAMETDSAQAQATETAAAPETPLTPEEKRLTDQRQKLAAIMRGETSVQLYLEFLHSHNHADLQVPALYLQFLPLHAGVLCRTRSTPSPAQ